MAPVVRQGELCITSYNSSVNRNSSLTTGTDVYKEDDKHALLYIVCTLLFYSLGMMIGIVSYIKREKQDIEQDRMFNDFLTSFRGKTEAIHYRQLKVQETIERLAEIEKGHTCYDDFNAKRSIREGRKLGRKIHKFANLSLLRTPVVVLNSMTSIAASNDQESDMDNGDPFQNRRLSEVVAEMLDNKCDFKQSESMEIQSYNQNENNMKTETIDYNREPENKLLNTRCTENIVESDFNNGNIVLEKNKTFGVNTTKQLQGKFDQESFQDSLINQSIKATKCRSIETSFGAIDPQENLDIPVVEQKRKETEFGPEHKQKEKSFRWSVTSV